MINEFIAHIKANVTPTVTNAFTTEPIEDYDDELPVIMIYPGDYTAELSELDNFIQNRVTQEVQVMIGCEATSLESTQAELRAAALGFETGNWDAFELTGGTTIGLDGKYIWVQETYITRLIVRQT